MLPTRGGAEYKDLPEKLKESFPRYSPVVFLTISIIYCLLLIFI